MTSFHSFPDASPLRFFALFLLFATTGLNVKAQQASDQERLNLPGDNFNLAGMLDVFRQSPTLEAFEAALNADTTKLNNLDLNNDGKVDYIKVFDRPDGDVHVIILQTDVGPNDAQDIAVIFVEKKGAEVNIQVVGDEDLYGPDYIIEPSSEKVQGGTPNPAYQGQQTNITNNYYYGDPGDSYRERPSYCHPPSSWIIIGFIYGPAYSPWISPWYWGYYPVWWSPWSPWYWDVYYVHWYYHRPWYGWWYWRTPYPHFRTWYGPYRTNRRTSNTVIRNRTEGAYDRTYRNPQPVARPDRKPAFPSHNLDIERNPAVIKQERKPDQQPVKDQSGVQPVKGKDQPSPRPQEPVKEKKERKPLFRRSSRDTQNQQEEHQGVPKTTPRTKTAPERKPETAPPVRQEKQRVPSKPR